MYKAEDFNIGNAPREMVQYIIDNVEGFESRYKHALSIMGRDRCSLQHADGDLFLDMCDLYDDWLLGNDPEHYFDYYDGIEEIFG